MRERAGSWERLFAASACEISHHILQRNFHGSDFEELCSRIPEFSLIPFPFRGNGPGSAQSNGMIAADHHRTHRSTDFTRLSAMPVLEFSSTIREH